MTLTILFIADLLQVLVVESTCKSHAIQNRGLPRKHAFQGLCQIVDIFTWVRDHEVLGDINLRKGSKNPKVPIDALNTGGTAPTLNSDEA